MGMLCRLLATFCFVSIPLFAGPLEEMNEFIQAHPWYGAVVEKAKKERRHPQRAPFVLAPTEGMAFAASQFVKKDASDADKQQAQEWLDKGVQAQVSMSNLGAELLTPLLAKERRYDSFYHLPVLTILTQIRPNQNVTDNAQDLYGTIIRLRYNDYRADGDFKPESVFTLLEKFFAFSQEDALCLSKKLCEQEPSQGFEKHIRLLLLLQKFDAPYFQNQITSLMSKHTSRVVVQSLQSNPVLRDLTQGSPLSVDSIFAQGLNPQKPMSQQIFTEFIGGDDAFREPFAARIIGHLGAYLRGSDNPNGCHVQLGTASRLLSSKIEVLRDGALKAIVGYLKDTDGLKTQFKHIKEWTGQTGILSSDIDQFLDRVLGFKEYEQVDAELFEAFSKVSFHQGVQKLWLKRIRSGKKGPVPDQQVRSYFGIDPQTVLGPIPEGEFSDPFNRALYHAQTASPLSRARVRAFLDIIWTTGLQHHVDDVMRRQDYIETFTDKDVPFEKKAQDLGGWLNSNQLSRPFTKEDAAALKSLVETRALELDPSLKELIEVSLIRYHRDFPEYKKNAALIQIRRINASRGVNFRADFITDSYTNVYDVHSNGLSTRNSVLLLGRDYRHFSFSRDKARIYAVRNAWREKTSVSAFDFETGLPWWDFSSGKEATQAHISGGTKTVCASFDNKVVFLNAETGEQISAFETPENQKVLSITPHGEDTFTLVVGKDSEGSEHGCAVWRLSARDQTPTSHLLKTFDGGGLRTSCHGNWVLQNYTPTGDVFVYDLRDPTFTPQNFTTRSPDRWSPLESSSIFGNRLFYVRSPQKDVFFLVCHDLVTKKEMWSESIEDASIDEENPFSPNGAQIYLTNREHLFVYQTDTTPRLQGKIDIHAVDGKGVSSSLPLNCFLPSQLHANVLLGMCNGVINRVDLTTGQKTYISRVGNQQELVGLTSNDIPLVSSQ